jgi:hypothetical protein
VHLHVVRVRNSETNIIKLFPESTHQVALVHTDYEIKFHVLTNHALVKAGSLVYTDTSFVPKGKSPDEDNI